MLSVGWLVIEEGIMIMQNALTLISPIYVRRKICELGIGMMKGNQVKDSGEEQREKVGSNDNCW